MMKNAWEKLTPQQKKTTVTIAAIAVVAFMSWIVVYMTQDNSGTTRKQARPVSHDLLTIKDPKTLGIDGLKAEIDQLKRQLNEVVEISRNSQTSANYNSSADSSMFPQLHSNLPGDLSREDMASLDRIRNASSINASTTPPAPMSYPPKLDNIRNNSIGEANYPQENSAIVNDENLNLPPKLKIMSYGEKEEEDGARIKKEPTSGFNGVETINGGKNAQNSRFVLPAGSILQGVFLVGLDAPTASQARQNPFPALVRIKKEALLPNRWRTDIRECFVMASGYGDLSSERAYLRAESISCVRDDGTIMESTMDGFASGEDGKNGIRGRLVSKQGQMIGQSLMAGFLEGIANIYKPANVPQLRIDPGDTSSYSRPDPSMAIEQGVAGGMQTAAKAVADFYLDMARNTFPIIEIDAGRKVSFIVGRSVNVTSRNAMPQQQVGNTNNTTMNYINAIPAVRALNQLNQGQGQ